MFFTDIPLLVLDVSLGIPISSANKGNRKFNIFSKLLLNKSTFNSDLLITKLSKSYQNQA
jgi:hypothetical protein